MLMSTSSYLFRMHAITCYGIETSILKLLKKNLNNISVVYHKPFNVFVVVIPMIVIMNVLSRHVYQFSNLFVSLIDFSPQKSPCLMIHKHYSRLNFVFLTSLEKFISENYQVTNVFDHPLCSIVS